MEHIPRGNGRCGVRVDPETSALLKRIVEKLDAQDLSVDHTMGDAVRWALGLPVRTAATRKPETFTLKGEHRG